VRGFWWQFQCRGRLHSVVVEREVCTTGLELHRKPLGTGEGRILLGGGKSGASGAIEVGISKGYL
jgi:hypothetical protein